MDFFTPKALLSFILPYKYSDDTTNTKTTTPGMTTKTTAEIP